MNWFDSIILGIVEGITEFLPVSSTGHLTIVEKLLGHSIDSPAVTAFTAIIQVGAIAAAILYFRKDIVRLAVGWFTGLFHADKRGTDYRLGWAVILGSIPIGLVGLIFHHLIETTLRSLWFVAGALIVWSFVLWIADRHCDHLSTQAPQRSAESAGLRGEQDLTIVDALIIGSTQCLALIPGVSRSGATISAALLRGIDRQTATRWSFFLGIPALTLSGILQAITNVDEISTYVGWGPTAAATVVSFGVAYASIAWLLKFVSTNRFTAFIVYRILIGLVIIALLVTGGILAV
ncbi:MAG: undecaprenyl-diphosphate phosphatase [Propionibacteriaceae bacterium]|jgi:undecaprenyl-diphosphatase|nr:undecaprenyl-diphosphate phosphatase [Propionibacteriaceae bacterium]